MKARRTKFKLVTGADAAALETAANAWLATAGEKEVIEWRVVDVGGAPVLVLYYTE